MEENQTQTERTCCKLDDAAAAIGGLTEMICLKMRQEERPENDAAKSPLLDRQVLDATAHIKVYTFYEIDHTKVPDEAPEQLRWTRVVMVTEKCKNGVVVRFPSVQSLRAHLSKSKAEVLTVMPSLDEKYVMEPEEAGEVLYRRVLPDEICENKNLWSFWVVSKRGLCWSELRSSGMLTWGRRKKVQFLGRHEEDEEEIKEGKQQETVKENRKRKRDVFTNGKRSSKLENNKKKKKKKGVKTSIDRWSKDRYKLAEENMLKILKEKGAVSGRPILRPALRIEARKLIGDTGLLDHLLKHMAGKVAPGGQERFRRRHNADGAMEYWLESAELVDIRKQAGVQDPYWTPPPGWNLGDNPTQDPVCAREIKQLKNEITQIRRDMQELLSKKQEDDFAVATQISCVSTTPNVEQESILLPLKDLYADLVTKKAKIDEQMLKISNYIIGIEKEIEKRKSSLEEPNKPLEAASTILSPMASASPQPPRIEKETTHVEQKKKQIVIGSDGQQEGDKGGGKTTRISSSKPKAATTSEDRASKIERLKSGFRICKPQGTFLWPDMGVSPQARVVVPQEDLFVVPSPPSVSSSTNPGHHLPSSISQYRLLPTSLVKPLPERRPVTVTLTAADNQSSHHPLPLATSTAQFVKNTSTSVTITTNTRTSLINLNVVPSNQNDGGSFGFHSQSSISTSPINLTYQSKHNETSTGAVPWLAPAQQENAMNQRHPEGERKEILMECEQKQKGISPIAMGTRTWLALAPPNLPSDSNSRRG